MNITRRSFLKGAVFLSVSACGGLTMSGFTAYDALVQVYGRVESRDVTSVDTDTGKPFAGRFITGLGRERRDPLIDRRYWAIFVKRGDKKLRITAAADRFPLQDDDEIVISRARSAG